MFPFSPPRKKSSNVTERIQYHSHTPPFLHTIDIFLNFPHCMHVAEYASQSAWEVQKLLNVLHKTVAACLCAIFINRLGRLFLTGEGGSGALASEAIAKVGTKLQHSTRLQRRMRAIVVNFTMFGR